MGESVVAGLNGRDGGSTAGNRIQGEEKHKEDVCDHILNSALHLFSTRGYFQTSVSDIIEHSGVSKSVLYGAFSSKEAIAVTLYRDVFERFDRTVAEIDRSAGTAYERLMAITEFLFALADQAPEVSRLLCGCCPGGLGAGSKSVESSPVFPRIKSMLKAGMEAGELRRMDPCLAYGCFFGVVTKPIRLHLEGYLEKPLTECFHEVWAVAWRAIQAPH